MVATILIVEDDPALIDVLEYNMAAEGYVVVKAATSAAADSVLTSTIPDLVLLDWDISRRFWSRPLPQTASF